MKAKQIFSMAALALFAACTPAADTEVATTPAAASAVPELKLPYSIEHPMDNWVAGKYENLEVVLTSLKAYENGDIEGSLAAFADSVVVGFDYLDKKVSKDSLRAMFVQGRKNMTAYRVQMNDWESVVSKDGKSEYVSLWYREFFTDSKGKIDSVAVMDDVKMSNGKIVELDQKIRHLGR